MGRRPSGDARRTRRAFLGGGSAAALGAALAVPAAASDAAGSAEAGRLLDVRDLGAVGDGEADDTEALQAALAQAEAQSVGTVYLPAGTFLLRDALRIPSNVRLRGAGVGLTTLRAMPETRFPLFRPDPRTQEIRQRRAMLTTESVGSVREAVAENVALAHLTIDWNHCPTDEYGSSCVLIDSADRCRIEQVRFIRCMPSDHPRQLEEMRGSRFRCECVMFANARHCVMDSCELSDSGYRPLSVSYGSQDITFQNGKIVASNPVWRHAFAEVHGDGIPRDEHFVRSQVKFLNSTFVLDGGTAQDGICSHTGTVFIENCDFYIRRGTKHFAYVVKPFDGSRRCQCLNNRFHCEGEYEERFSIIGSIGDRTNEEMLFVGNVVDVAFDAASGDRMGERGLVDFSRSERRCRVQDNQFLIRYEESLALPAIRLANSNGFTVAGNLIEFRGEAGDEGPVGIVLEQCESGTVTANVVSGDCGLGMRLSGELDGVLVTGNSFAANESLTDDSQGNTRVEGNAILGGGNEDADAGV